MSIAAVFEFPNDSVEKYEKVIALGGPSSINPGESHTCVIAPVMGSPSSTSGKTGHRRRLRSGDRAGPARSRLDGKPAIHPVQGTISRDGRVGR